jgi:hypothetical protein
MVADPVVLLLVACSGIVLAELLRYLAQSLLRLLTDQVVLVCIPLVLRLALFTALGIRLSSSLAHLIGALEIVKTVMP